MLAIFASIFVHHKLNSDIEKIPCENKYVRTKYSMRMNDRNLRIAN